MAISDNVRKVKNGILQDLINGTNVFTQNVQDKSSQAILKGFSENPDCVAYMELFKESPAELDRLMGRDGTTGPGHEGKDRARAYLMAAGPCGTDTVTTFDKGVTKILDL